MSIYLDNSATSFPKPQCVYEKIEQFMRNNGVSPGRGTYAKAIEAEQMVYNTRKSLCKLLGVKKPSNIIFTSNATEAINLGLKGFLRENDEVLTSNVEHNAVWRPLKNLEKHKNIKIHTFNCKSDGTLDVSQIKEKLKENIKLISITHGSNVLGNILPIEEIACLAHEKGIKILVDCAQTAGVIPINCNNIDMLAFTGHKGLLGPTGTGGMCIKSDLELATLKEGGTGSMAKSDYPPKLPPDRYEAGTLNSMGIAGLGAAVDYLLEVGADTIQKHENKLMERLLDGLSQISNVIIYGTLDANLRLGLVSFNVKNLDPYKVAKELDDKYGIMVRAGLHCAPQTHMLLGTENMGAIRASISLYNSIDEMDALIKAIKEIAKGF